MSVAVLLHFLLCAKEGAAAARGSRLVKRFVHKRSWGSRREIRPHCAQSLRCAPLIRFPLLLSDFTCSRARASASAPGALGALTSRLATSLAQPEARTMQSYGQLISPNKTTKQNPNHQPEKLPNLLIETFTTQVGHQDLRAVVITNRHLP